MADTKITDLAALSGANAATGDLLPVVDVSDTSMAASGTDKKLTLDGLREWFDQPVALVHTCGTIGQSIAAGTYWWVDGSSAIASGTGSTTPPLFLVFNTSDWPNVENMNLHVSLVTTAAQTGVTFTFGLYPVTISGTTSVVPTLGTVVSGSTVAFSAPGAASENRGNSGDFAAPSADCHVVGLVTSATTAASSRTWWTCTLRGLP